MNEDMIQVNDLKKVYHIGNEKVNALNKIDFNIARGEICCIFGTSGSGKSTLLNQMAGFEKPSKGQVIINGINICELNENQLAAFRQDNIGFVFQSYNLLPTLTALENVGLPMQFKGISKADRQIRAMRMLKQVGLQKRVNHKPNQMSGGQQQRVGIARAFAAEPKIIFADEPTGNLDSKTTIEVMETMVKMARKNNQTLILVTHDQELAQYADRIVTLMDGRIIKDVENNSIMR